MIIHIEVPDLAAVLASPVEAEERAGLSAVAVSESLTSSEAMR